MTDAALARLRPRLTKLYLDLGRPSIPPEQLLRALLLQVLYSVRSERLLIEQLDYNLLFRWFVGLGLDERVWNHSTFSKNRDRLVEGEIAQAFFEAVRREADAHRLLSDEHFTVDGTLLEAWASHKSFRRKDEDGGGPPDDPSNPSANFRGERRTNDTHQSTTDPDARLYKKGVGRPAQLAYFAHVLLENRSGLVVDTRVTPADGYAERDAALMMLAKVPGGRVTVAADKGYDYPAFVAELRRMRVTPHVAQNTTNRRSAIDAPEHPSSRVCRQSTETEARRRNVWVDEDRRPRAQVAASWRTAGRVDLLLHRRRLQPRADSESGLCVRVTSRGCAEAGRPHSRLCLPRLALEICGFIGPFSTPCSAGRSDHTQLLLYSQIFKSSWIV